MGRFNLDIKRDRETFLELNLAIMKWGQAKLGLALAERLHLLRKSKKDQNEWRMSDTELLDYWRDIIAFKG